MNRKLGAYVLAGDPVWLASSLARYYPHLDSLIVLAPSNGRGWTGYPVPVDTCLEVVREVDTRGIAQLVWGEWEDRDEPVRADTAQRQAGIDALTAAGVEWILQIDNDELLPGMDSLFGVLDEAERRHIGAVEWPMRVLFRRLGHGRYLEVRAGGGAPRYDYPGPIAVRPGSTAIDARRVEGSFLRPTVEGDTSSLQVRRPPSTEEIRVERLRHEDAIIHNSWARSPADIRRKIRSWGHAMGLRSEYYYWTRWWAAPLRWRSMRDFHPFSRGLWPSLSPIELPDSLLSGRDRRPQTTRD